MIKLSNLKVTTSSIDKWLIAGDATYFNMTQNNNSAFNANGAAASTGMQHPTITNDLRIRLNNGSFVDTFENFDNLSATNSNNLLNEYNKVRITYNIYTGDGSDGNIIISGTKNINTNVISSKRSRPDAVNFNVINLTATTARLSTTPVTGDLTAGDEILLMNIQGTPTNYTNTGKWETIRIKSISGDTITFTTSKTNKYGSGANDDLNIGTTSSTQRVMIQRIPQYNDMTIDTGNTLTANAWDGTKGGILFFRVAGTIIIYGSVNMDTKGYRGGPGFAWGGTGASGYRGESIDGGYASRDYPTVGGGSPNNTGGSYGTQGSGSSATTYGEAEISHLFMGSGGASGGSGGSGYNGDPGGNGGGLICIMANSMTFNGTFSTIGGNGTQGDYRRGGAGSGGAVLVKAKNFTIGTSTISVTGGSAGNPGGYGRIAIYYKDIVGTINTTPSAYSLETTPVNTSNVMQSSKILDGHIVNNIQNFKYRLERKPSGTDVKIQFSQDQTNQYSASGILDGHSTLTTDTTIISLAALNSQTGTNFYYKIDMSSDGNDSPVLDQIEIEYDPDTYESTEQYQISHIMDTIVGARIRTLVASQVLDQSDQINPKFQLIASNTGNFTGEETIFPNGPGNYYQLGGTFPITNDEALDVQGHVGYNFYRYQRIKAVLDAGYVTTDAPVLKLVGFQGILKSTTNNQLVGDSTDELVATITKNTSVKVLEKTITVSESHPLMIIGELQLDNTGYDTPNGTTTNMQVSRDGTQLHEKLSCKHLQKNQYQKYIVDTPPIGTVKYQIWASESDDKCDVIVVNGNIRILT